MWSFKLLVSDFRLWPCDTTLEGREDFLHLVCHAGNSTDTCPPNCTSWKAYGPHNNVVAVSQLSPWPPVPAIQHPSSAPIPCGVSVSVPLLFDTSCHLCNSWTRVGLPRFLVLLFHLTDNYWPGRLHSWGLSESTLPTSLQSCYHWLVCLQYYQTDVDLQCDCLKSFLQTAEQFRWKSGAPPIQ